MKVAELPPIWERAIYLYVVLLFVLIYLSSFPFDVEDKVWDLIQSVPEANLLFQFGLVGWCNGPG